MKSAKLLSLLSIFLVLTSLSAAAQKKTIRLDLNVVISVPCTGEILGGTMTLNRIDQVSDLTGISYSYSAIHSGELTSKTGNNVYRLAGCSEEISMTDGVETYYGVWHFVGKKGNGIRVIVTARPGNVPGYFSDRTLWIEAECE